MKNPFPKIALRIGLGLCVLVLIAAAALLIVVQHPSLVLRPGWVARFSEKAGLQWKGLEISSRSAALLEPVVRLSWESFTFHSETVDAQAGPGELTLRLSFRHLLPRVLEAGPARIALSKLELRPAPPSNAPNPRSSGGIPSWLGLASMKVGRTRLRVDNWVIPGDSGRLSVERPAASSRWHLHASELAHRASLSVTADNPSGAWNGPWDAKLTGTAKEPMKGIRRISLHRCRLEISGESLISSCPILATISLPHIPRLRKIAVVETFPFLLSAHLSSKNIFDTRRRIHGDADLQLLPLDPFLKYRDLARAWGEARVSGSGIPAEPASRWNIESTVDLRVKIARFQKLVRVLDGTDYAIPAPLHALEGSLDFSIRGKLTPHTLRAPIRVVTRLSSPNQNLDIQLTGTAVTTQLEPTLRSLLSGTAVLTNVRIPLPRLSFQGLPRITPDARLARAAQAHERAGTAPPAVEYRFAVKTGNEPIRVLTNLAKSPVPVRLNLKLSSGAPIVGNIHIDSFPLDLFRRNAKVEHIDIDLTPKEKRLHGVVDVNYTDYLIRIILSGTLDQPEVKFESEPALSDQDVISVLLFGRTTEDLDQGQSQSVTNVSAAATNRSLDLASLYLLASTPIESVGYDPESGSISVKFKLASGTTLNVAEAQSALESIGIRQRIGSHWAVTTQYGNPANPNDKSISTLLEWSHRY